VLGLDDGEQRHPVFQAVLTGDVAFYGFELTPDEARGANGDPGWFFVLQEHPSEPRFNRPDAGGPNVTAPEYPDLGDGSEPAVAADVASRAYDAPLRVAFHGRDLVPG
jgi:hypothetical protein